MGRNMRLRLCESTAHVYCYFGIFSCLLTTHREIIGRIYYIAWSTQLYDKTKCLWPVSLMRVEL